MKRILFVTDSIGSPRNIPEKCTFNDTWCYQVSKNIGNMEVLFENIHGLDTDMLIGEFLTRISLYEPDIIILQVGIVDCAPRVFTKFQLRVVKFLKLKFLHSFVSSNYAKLSKVRNIAYVSQSVFHENLIQFINALDGIQIYALSIAPPSSKLKSKSPLMNERVATYNNILEEVFKNNFIDPFKNIDQVLLDDMYMSDLIHFNKDGQSYISHFVKQSLNSILQQ